MMIGSEFVAKNINLKCDRPLVSSLVYGDRERLRQLFGNLLVNSLKYTDEGGELRIDVTNQGGKVVVDFQDSAPGVPATELDKLFESFYRVDSSRNRATGGAGLGLAICRNIVKAHEGTIVAKPSALGGVWIRVEIPSYGRGV
jgi:two-component system sensor histidine kinase BaeS